MKRSYLFAFAAIFCWSTVATVSKLLLGSYQSLQVLCISTLLGAVCLFFVNLFLGNLKKMKKLGGKDYAILSVIGLPGILIYNLFLYGGMARMDASQAFIVNYLWPIMSVVFACVILKEKMTPRKLLAIGISFLGVIIVTGPSLVVFDVTALLGALSCAMGAVSYGIFTALNQKFCYDKCIAMMIYYVVAFAITLLILLLRGEFLFPTGLSFLGFAWNGVFSMAAGTTCWAIALESGKTAKISNLAYITPFLSLVWTGLILKEKLSVFSVAGLAVIILGIFIQLKEKPDR